jgi:hypothetical protein
VIRLLAKILAATVEGSTGCVVTFKTEYGSARAHWTGPTPECGRTYDAEIEIPQVLHWRTDIAVANDCQQAIRDEGKIIHMIVKLESVSSDGVAAARLGRSLISFETIGTPYPPGTLIELRVYELYLYDSNI